MPRFKVVIHEQVEHGVYVEARDRKALEQALDFDERPALDELLTHPHHVFPMQQLEIQGTELLTDGPIHVRLNTYGDY